MGQLSPEAQQFAQEIIEDLTEEDRSVGLYARNTFSTEYIEELKDSTDGFKLLNWGKNYLEFYLYEERVKLYEITRPIDTPWGKDWDSEWKVEAVDELYRGEHFFISPSMGFADIPEGEVKIVRISRYEDVCQEYADPEVIVEDDPETRKGDWIVYSYTRNNPKDLWRQFYCLDEENFRAHVKKPWIKEA